MAIRDGVLTYQVQDQQVLVADCNALLHWDLFRFDCWLFDSRKWSMYTRRRQQLIELRTNLVTDWKINANDFAARDRLIADFCIEAWDKTRTQELRGIPEVQELDCAYRTAKSVRRKQLSKGMPKGQSQNPRLLPHALGVGSGKSFSI